MDNTMTREEQLIWVRDQLGLSPDIPEAEVLEHAARAVRAMTDAFAPVFESIRGMVRGMVESFNNMPQYQRDALAMAAKMAERYP